jgi:hypothetical protein
MECAGCGGAWFVEEKQVIATSEPEQISHSPRPVSISRERYVYRCAECALPYGEEPRKRKRR